MEHFVLRWDDAQFQTLVDILSALGDQAKLQAITKQLRESQKNLSKAITADTPPKP